MGKKGKEGKGREESKEEILIAKQKQYKNFVL